MCNEKEKLYTAKELARILQVSADTIWRWGRNGLIRSVRIGKVVRFYMPEEGRWQGVE